MPGKKAPEESRREQIVQAAFRVAVREELEQLTIRQVAAEAGLSTGLVFFHFKSKEALLLALLDQLLASLFETWEVPETLSPLERLLAWLQLDLQDLSQDEQGHMKVFLSYWMLAARDPTIDERMKGALERSKQTLLPIVQAVIDSDPERFRQITPEGLVTVVLAITQGIAMQSLLSTQRVDAEHILPAIRALLLAPSPGEQVGIEHGQTAK
jgi:TetR/AcrR family transcriptional regulator, transcriptional repressor of bet genes